MTNLGLWAPQFQNATPFPYGSELTYRRAAEFLAGCRTIDDWGCGTQWFRGVMSDINPMARVTGLDGSAGYCDRVVDLADYRPERLPDGLCLRHVLELDGRWREILKNALQSFSHRMVLILFTPLAEVETKLAEFEFPEGGRCPYLALPQHEIEQIISATGANHRIEVLPISETEFGHETLIFISRPRWSSTGPALQSGASGSDKDAEELAEFPFVSCLCPTYRRPELLANSLACFLSQDYPAHRRELIILDDAGQFCCTRGSCWELVSLHRRFHSLPEKFNALAGLASGDVLVVWEDDDIYLPWHISGHITAMRTGLGFSKPSQVRYYAEESLQTQSATGRFHASIAFRKDWHRALQGWPLTGRGDFDQQMIQRLSQMGPVADPLEYFPPSYVFRWESTGSYHGSALMVSPEDEAWYGLAGEYGDVNSGLSLCPQFDAHTLKCFADHRLALPEWTESSHIT